MSRDVSSSVRVAVRVRPFNARERKRNAKCIVTMKGNVTQVENPNNQQQNTFAFDFSHWSHDPNTATAFADQRTVYNDVGKTLLDHAFQGYNACILAYGQTGAGKSYTMMGDEPGGPDAGIIPRLCEEMFQRIQQSSDNQRAFAVEVSYLEIYNERVWDLLNPSNSTALRVREHPLTGPYVEDLSRLAVTSYNDISQHIDAGNRGRKVASTNMNARSSRSHAVFSIHLTMHDEHAPKTKCGGKASKLNLVDLAGSERVTATGARGARLKEGANINRSLTALGKVIAALAEKGDGGRKKRRALLVPYRESALTWLLKESLGGNSKTFMIAAVSPADINHEETLSTLRYADRAKQIVCKAIVNEDPTAKMIRELQEEVAKLQLQLAQHTQRMPTPPATSEHGGTGKTGADHREALKARLEQSQKLMSELTVSWEDKLAKADEIKLARQEALKSMGIKLSKSGDSAVGVFGPRDQPHLVNVSECLHEDELVLYYLTGHETTVNPPLQGLCVTSTTATGASDATANDGAMAEPPPSGNAACTIVLSSTDIVRQHCSFFKHADGVRLVRRHPSALVFVDGLAVTDSVELESGMLVQLGEYHVLRFVDPRPEHRASSRAWSRSTSASRAPSPTLCNRSVSLRELAHVHRRRSSASLHTPGAGPVTAAAGCEVEEFVRENGPLSVPALESLVCWHSGVDAHDEEQCASVSRQLRATLATLLLEGRLLQEEDSGGAWLVRSGRRGSRHKSPSSDTTSPAVTSPLSRAFSLEEMQALSASVSEAHHGHHTEPQEEQQQQREVGAGDAVRGEGHSGVPSRPAAEHADDSFPAADVNGYRLHRGRSAPSIIFKQQQQQQQQQQQRGCGLPTRARLRRKLPTPPQSGKSSRANKRSSSPLTLQSKPTPVKREAATDSPLLKRGEGRMNDSSSSTAIRNRRAQSPDMAARNTATGSRVTATTVAAVGRTSVARSGNGSSSNSPSVQTDVCCEERATFEGMVGAGVVHVWREEQALTVARQAPSNHHHRRGTGTGLQVAPHTSGAGVGDSFRGGGGGGGRRRRCEGEGTSHARPSVEHAMDPHRDGEDPAYEAACVIS